MKVAVVGAAGQLGRATAAWWRARAEVSALTRSDVDLTDAPALEATLLALAPDLVLNCAAYNDVDGAETNPVAALSVNAMAVRSMAAICARLGAPLVHYGTDFVFDGQASEPYTEEASARPQSVYGASKLLGDWLAATAPRAYVLRVESLFGGIYVRSSIDRIIQSLRDGRETPVFLDRVVSPSYVADVITATAALLDRQAPPGVYHCVNSGQTTWLELGQEIARLLGAEQKGSLKPVRVADIPMKVKRPQFCALSNAKLRAAGVEMPDWRDAIRRHLVGPPAPQAGGRQALDPRR
jgi:dTDP-4-dehydrorhamnose reductase